MAPICVGAKDLQTTKEFAEAVNAQIAYCRGLTTNYLL